MELALKAILPAFAIIIVGFIAGKTKILGENSEHILTKFVFYFALPAALFVPLAEESISNILNLAFIGVFGLSTIIVYVFGFFASLLFKSTTIKQASVTALSASCPNTIFLGIPILFTLFGAKAILPISIGTMFMYLVTVASIFIIETNLRKTTGFSCKIVGHILLDILRNPLIVTILLGIVFSVLKIKLPFVISSFGHQLGSVAGPCALFAIGQTLAGCRIFTTKAESAVVLLLKLILHPALILLFTFVLHLSGFWAVCAFILGAIPTATMSYIIATRYHINPERSATLIFEATLLSLITLPICIMIAIYMWPGVIVAIM